MIRKQTAPLITRAQMQKFDDTDPLRTCRDAFLLPAEIIYMDGNSLGALPAATPPRLQRVIDEEWRHGLIRSWNAAEWIHLPLQVGRKIATLVGARPEEVVVADSTSVNLFKVLAAALQLRPDRSVIVSEAGNFPSDLYMIQGLLQLLGNRHELRLVDPDNIEAALGDDVAAVCLTHVNYKTAYMHDMANVTQLAHRHGALMIWDLAHSAGSMPIDLNTCEVDLAVGCGYKFLNGGPGAPAFLFVAERHQDEAQQPLTGWLGHSSPFDFDPVYAPAPGIARFLCGTPAVLSMSALDAGLDVILNVDLLEVRKKSMRLGELFLDLVSQECDDDDLQIACPLDPEHRGSQVCLSHPEGYAIVQALISRGVVPDYRAPNVLRFGLTPLYQRYVDIWDAVSTLQQILHKKLWRNPQFHKRSMVT